MHYLKKHQDNTLTYTKDEYYFKICEGEKQLCVSAKKHTEMSLTDLFPGKMPAKPNSLRRKGLLWQRSDDSTTPTCQLPTLLHTVYTLLSSARLGATALFIATSSPPVQPSPAVCVCVLAPVELTRLSGESIHDGPIIPPSKTPNICSLCPDVCHLRGQTYVSCVYSIHIIKGSSNEFNFVNCKLYL